MLEANFWQDKNNSKKVIKEKKLFEDLSNTYKVSIEKLLKDHNATIHSFYIYIVGDGIEKKEEDFAAEVAAVSKG